MSGNVTSQLPSLSRRILATIRSFIALAPAALDGQGMARGRARPPGAFRPAGLDHGARAPLFGIGPPRIRLSRDSLADGLAPAYSPPLCFVGGRIGRSRVHRSRQYIALSANGCVY